SSCSFSTCSRCLWPALHSSLHDALPILACSSISPESRRSAIVGRLSSRDSTLRLSCERSTTATSSSSDRFLKVLAASPTIFAQRSEEHTSELQSREKLVCRLLLDKKKKR